MLEDNPIPEEEKTGKKIIKPLSVVDNFYYHPPETGKYPAPFASKEEFRSKRKGSENIVLMTLSEPILSTRFVQCSGAMVRNRRTGLISLVHQSLWSMAAEAAIALQHSDDLDLIVLDPRKNGLPIKRSVERAYHQNYEGDFGRFLEREESLIRSSEISHTFGERDELIPISGRIIGINESHFDEMMEKSRESELDGSINYLGTVELPINRDLITTTSILYRPSENLIYVLNDTTKQLFVFPGFP